MALQKVLVIDDSRMIRMRIKDMLNEMMPGESIEITEARDGREGLDMVQAQSPDLILLDFLLPKMSGWEVYQELQKQPTLQSIPLVVMSGRKEEVTEKISEPFEHFAFVEKPFEPEQLVNAIKDARANVRGPQPEPVVATVGGGSEEVNRLKLQVADLTDKVTSMQKQVDTLNKQMAQLVAFIKKRLS
ncbi:MAG: response regulator [Cyanobacteria bacterium J06641_5]